MMNKFKVFFVGLFLLTPLPAFAQSTASQVISGYLTTTGCKNGETVCFKVASSYAHLNTAASTQVFSGPGEIFNLTVNNKSGGASTATLYNNTACSGAVFAVVDTNGNDPVTLNYGAKLSTGLCVTKTSTSDLTITYRTN